MAVRGITGAMMSGPMEQTKLIEFPYEAMRQRNLDLEDARLAAMQNTLDFKQNMDALGNIPGTEDIALDLTQSYRDKLDAIYEQTKGDPAKAAPMIENLMFDYQSNKSKEIKEREKAVAGYQALQAQLSNPDSNVDPRTASAYLNNAVQNYINQQKAYAAGEGPIPSSTVFSGMPVATPDMEKTLLALQDKIKPDQYANYGYIQAKDDKGRVIPGMYTKGVTSVKYSDAQVRQALTANFLKQLTPYQNFAAQQYELGLSSRGRYNKEMHGGLMDIEAMINPLLQPLSEDPNIKANQLAMAGAKTESEYLQMQNVERANKEALYNKTIQNVANQNNISPEEAEQYLASNAFARMETEGILDEMASASAIGSFQQQKLSDIDSDGSNIDFQNIPYQQDKVYDTDQIITGPPAYTDGDKINQSLTTAQDQLAQIQEKLQSPLVSEEEKTRLREQVSGLETDILNLQKNEIPFQVMDVITRYEKDNTQIINRGQAGAAVKDISTPEGREKHMQNVADILTEFYDLTGKYKTEDNKIDSEAFAKDLNTFVSLSDFDWNQMKNEEGWRTVHGIYADDLAYMVDDVRDKMARFKRLDQVERTADYVVPEPLVAGGIEKNSGERLRVDSRARNITADNIRVFDPLKEGVLIQDTNTNEYEEMLEYINSNFSTGDEQTGNVAQWAPQTYSAGWFGGKPAFIMDMAYYTKGDNLHRIDYGQMRDAEGIVDDLEYGNVPFSERSKLLVHLSTGDDAYNDLRIQRENEIRMNLSAGNIDGAMNAAITATQMELNQRFMPALQGSQIETMRSIDFDAMGQGFVSQNVDPNVFPNALENANGEIVYDPATHSLKIEKITQPDGSSMYQLYSLPYKGAERNVRDEAERDYFVSNGQRQWGNLEDLIFNINGGNILAQNKVNSATIFLQGQD